MISNPIDKITAKDIQRAIMVDRYRRSICCPNYTPNKWWECDVFELTPNGYFREYEIKLTLGDFKADELKTEKLWWYDPALGGVYKDGRNKHQLLGMGDPIGPANFYFVSPLAASLVDRLPIWAGLIDAQRNEWGQTTLTQLREAPRLHSFKVDEAVKKHVNTVFYYRFHSMFLKAK